MHIGSLSSSGLRFGVVVARFNELVTKPLLEGVLEGLERHGTARECVQVWPRHQHKVFTAGLQRSFCSVSAAKSSVWTPSEVVAWHASRLLDFIM